MADIIPTSLKEDLGEARIDWTSDTFKVMLLTSTASPAASWAKRSDLTNEVSGTGYTAGGATLSGTVINTSSTTKQYDATDVSWSTATITARYAAVYKSRGGLASADELVVIHDFGSDKTSTAGTFTIQWNASGLFTIS
jgi:hypothetical protein